MPVEFLITAVASSLSPDLRQSALAARTLGLDGVLVDVADPGSAIVHLSDTGQREVRQIFASRNLVLAGLDVALPARAFRPESDIDQVLSFCRSALNACRGLGATVLCLDVGQLPVPPAPPAPKPPRISPEQAGLIIIPSPADIKPSEAPVQQLPQRQPEFEASTESAMRELCAHADRLGVVLALRSQLSSLESLAAILHRLDCPWFGVDLDPVGILKDDWLLDDVFDRLGTLIRHVRGRDAIGGTQRRTQPALIGRGDTNWPALLANLQAADYRGGICLDPRSTPDSAAAIRHALDYFKPYRQSSR